MSPEIISKTHTITLDSIPYYILHEAPISTTSEPKLIILIHALMSNLHMWDSTVKCLHSQGYATLRYDHVGHGQTPPPPRTSSETQRYTFDTFTQHLHEIHTTLLPDVQPCGVVGCSIGGVLSLRYSQMYPSSTLKTLSIAPPGGLRTIPSSAALWKDRITQFRENGVDDLARATIQRWFPDPCSQEIRDESLKLNLGTKLEGYEICANAVMGYDYLDDLEKIRGEVLVVVGRKDGSIGPLEIIEKEVVVGLTSLGKKARFVVMEGVGHLPPVHDRKGFEELMVEFLNQRI